MMEDDSADNPANPDEKIVEDARARYKRDSEYWSEIYRKAKEDLDFLSDDRYAQWDQRDYEDRLQTGRPALTIDQLGQFIHQVANDIRMNTPSINPIPANNEADQETAEIFKGLIKAIEYDSNAAEAYDTAVDFAIRCSIGYIRIDHEYADDTGFDQKLVIKRVINPLSVFLDSNSIESDGRDAKHCTIIDEMTVAEFEKLYPGKEACSFDTGQTGKQLKETDTINIAEQFCIVEDAMDIMLTHDDQVAKYQDGTDYKLKRTIKRTTIERYKLSGAEVLEKTTFPGRYIPMVPVYGEEQWIDGKRNLLSLIRKSKDAQRMYNVWKSLETEIIMKQPQAPVMVAEGAIEDYAADWKNPAKAMALRYKTTDINGNPIPPPQRLEPPSIPAGIVNASRETVEDIKATMGIYNASLGTKSNVVSGVAYNSQKSEGDVATFHFGDNLVRSITQCGRVTVFAIPETYDASRVIQIIGAEDEPQQVGINGAAVPDQDRHYDLTKGVYNVRVITGPSFTTQRQETVAALNEIFKANPQLMQVFGDIYFKNSDFTGASALAARAEKLLPPQLQDQDQLIPAAAQQKIAQQGQQLQQAMQIIQQGAQKLQELQQKVDSKDNELAVKAQDGQNKAQNEQDKNHIEAASRMADAAQRNRELDIQEMQVAGTLAIQAMQMKLDALTASMQTLENRFAPESSANSGGV